MVQTWSSGRRSDITCPNCGAVFEATIKRIPHRDKDNFNCTECGERVAEWNTTELRSFKLIRPGSMSASP